MVWVVTKVVDSLDAQFGAGGVSPVGHSLQRGWRQLTDLLEGFALGSHAQSQLDE